MQQNDLDAKSQMLQTLINQYTERMNQLAQTGTGVSQEALARL